ncbi:MAG TPA: hypothetical protein DCG06_08970, partial [Deltaproteobacteria bacterium]|nr:hypothetical protein [Deltaproteobacteria bacterium]
FDRNSVVDRPAPGWWRVEVHISLHFTRIGWRHGFQWCTAFRHEGAEQLKSGKELPVSYNLLGFPG